MAWQDDFAALSTDQQRATLRTIGNALAGLTESVEAKASSIALVADEDPPLPETIADLALVDVTSAATLFVAALAIS